MKHLVLLGLTVLSLNTLAFERVFCDSMSTYKDPYTQGGTYGSGSVEMNWDGELALDFFVSQDNVMTSGSGTYKYFAKSETFHEDPKFEGDPDAYIAQLTELKGKVLARSVFYTPVLKDGESDNVCKDAKKPEKCLKKKIRSYRYVVVDKYLNREAVIERGEIQSKKKVLSAEQIANIASERVDNDDETDYYQQLGYSSCSFLQ